MRKQLQLKLFAYTNIAALALLGYFIFENYQSQGLIFQVAKNDDIILIAGKGHEKYQEINGVRHSFDDVKIIEKLLK